MQSSALPLASVSSCGMTMAPAVLARYTNVSLCRDL